ncbi:UDP-glucoronosyl and UDP-glucosyl transferase, putative [Beauveria bassiana ARSEF 2860]|uniref:UDP-glucoronosyl and UDP-glucosyl transferase, putative n=1 Tax=Beauveria bassiana (strain ARSEF 2860) TaxID=655819 RepID=J5JSA2_BEAB2|nr:UDP-glucoronosyl and UDP-glucosyl transferase, putative [Beauveria bassiana ARSEF 2860]EJP67803.1 UDP-glucoronosyl and UDP-glucosyl transferase, putative [Beauveria bassiana ARSEF 2860]
MADGKKILMLTNSEHGQANVFLATAHELLQLDQTAKVYICSFPALGPSVDSIRELNKEKKPAASRLEFISLSDGPSWKDALFGRPEHQFQELNDIRPTVWNVAKAAKLTRIACPWTAEELCSLVKEIEKIIENVDPDLTVVDNLFTPAVTICYKLKPQWMVLSPNTYKEFALAKQPNQQYYWKYPPDFKTAINNPVPGTLVSDAVGVMKKAIDTDYADWAYISIIPPEGLKVLLASRPEIDFPFDVKPEHMIPCGPIIRPSMPIQDADSELAGWLAKRPTVLVNLGTHASYDEQHARGMAGALDQLLEAAKKGKKPIQVLWKLNKRDGSDPSGDLLKSFTTKWPEDLRVVSWLDVEPTSILESGHVLTGRKKTSAGVPQVILPVWGDTYDFAKRAEWLGIGKFGSWNHAPKVEANELGRALKQVVLGPQSSKFQAKATELATLCRGNGGGRHTAAQTILNAIEK